MNAPQIYSIEPEEGGEDGESGKDIEVALTNEEFIAAVFKNIPQDAYAAICSKKDDPKIRGWKARRVDPSVSSCLIETNNNYVGCSSFYIGNDGSFRALKAQFAACHFLMLDDLGTKISFDRLNGLKLTWLIETSPGNHQGGIVLTEPIVDGDIAVRLLNSIIEAGMCDAGASGPLYRWARLPVAINGKLKYKDDEGKPFQCVLKQWRPSVTYSPDELIDLLQINLLTVGRTQKQIKSTSKRSQIIKESLIEANVLTVKAEQNPVVKALKDNGLYKTPLGSAKHDITCPWLKDHTDQIDSGSAYFEPDEHYQLGGFKCQHSHGDKYHIRQLLDFLNIPTTEARHKSAIKVKAGDLHLVVDAAEKELADYGRHYQSGGLIVSVSTDPTTGDPFVIPISSPALTKVLSAITNWEKFDVKKLEWYLTDPPQRHVAVLYDSQIFEHLPPLAGVARQPYFRETDGVLIAQPGYDSTTHRFGVFDAKQYVLPEPTIEAARTALSFLEDLLTEFHFLTPKDKSAALSAIFTAVVRPTLAAAPAFHVRAPVFGSGKTYLCELIGSFAGPGANAKVSYPLSSEEATKVMLSLLLTSPAVIEFDDMDTDWIPHGTIKRMLTADQITDRILGFSKTATVSTRSLFLGSGNNVGPVRDLLRRVLTIHVDPRCATPATMTYRELPVEKVRKNRAEYVTAVLIIIQAWRNANMPKASVDSIATYSGAWSDYCRHPLIWLGHPDPANSLLDQIRHDPDADALAGLMTEWYSNFGSTPTTVRKAVDTALDYRNGLLHDAIREFPVEQLGEINRSKFGWVLKKNANRIVGEFEFQESLADGRKAWRVVKVNSPPLPPSPTLNPSSQKAYKPWMHENNKNITLEEEHER